MHGLANFKCTINVISLEKNVHYGVVIFEVFVMVGSKGMVLRDVTTCGLTL